MELLVKVLKSRVLFLLFVWLFDSLIFAYIKIIYFLQRHFACSKCLHLLQVLQYLGKSSSHQSHFKTCSQCISSCSFMSIIHLE